MVSEEFEINGKFLKIATIEDEWYQDVEDPEKIITKIKQNTDNIDIFSFWQRLPDTKPKYQYYFEYEYIAALPITDFDTWYNTQISSRVRNQIKKSEKKGIVIRHSEFDDDFVRGMTDIFNESPVRQGRPFWHYGKSFEVVKKQFSRYLFREEMIGAYLDNELVGFIMLGHADNYAIPGQIISKIEHRDKNISNALIAGAVKICEEQKIPYLVYFFWGDGGLAEFKRRNGFIRTGLPRYYIPLSFKGWLFLKLKLHHGLKNFIPDRLMLKLKDLRSKWYMSGLNE